ncbi:MAG: iron dicitrate transport regulator FecR [Deltaproteobacteria bacterium]|nr:iron dicitrate transport regulator FecR [Deltaproteobacteria bacterium]
MEWEEYSHNFPVVERARVSIPKDSEAEIQFRGSQYLLLEGGSEVDVRQLGERKASFRLRTGRAAFSLSKEDFAPVTVKLPGDRDVSLDAPGLYWLTVDGQTAKLDVRRGEGTVSGEGVSPVAVAGGEEASIGKEVKVSKAGHPENRPPAEPTLTEAELKAGIPGAAATELRGHGEWVWTSDYGYVWRPNVTDDWAPYYYGRWAWVYPYGWNWVGYEPWGWWPYHYGWWVTVGAWGWVWAPYNSFYYGPRPMDTGAAGAGGNPAELREQLFPHRYPAGSVEPADVERRGLVPGKRGTGAFRRRTGRRPLLRPKERRPGDASLPGRRRTGFRGPGRIRRDGRFLRKTGVFFPLSAGFRVHRQRRTAQQRRRQRIHAIPVVPGPRYGVRVLRGRRLSGVFRRVREFRGRRRARRRIQRRGRGKDAVAHKARRNTPARRFA